MYYSEMLAETTMEPADYQEAERELTENGWTLSTYVVEGSSRLGSHKLCDIWVEVVSPDGERWAENLGPIHTEDGIHEAEAALKTAQWAKDHWTEVMSRN